MKKKYVKVEIQINNKDMLEVLIASTPDFVDINVGDNGVFWPGQGDSLWD